MADKKELLQSILGFISDDDKPEATSLLETAVGAVAGGGSSSGGNLVSGILGALLSGGDKKEDTKDGGFDLGGLVSGIIGGGKSDDNAEDDNKPNVLMELLPKIIGMIKPEDLGKVKDLLVGLLT